MIISFSKTVLEQMNGDIEQFISKDAQRWRDPLEVNLAALTKEKSKLLLTILQKYQSNRTIKLRIADVEHWLKIMDGEKVACKSIKDFAAMLKQYLKNAPKHWVYERRSGSDMYQPYYVSSVKFIPRESGRRSDYPTPAHVVMTLQWEELGSFHTTSDSFYKDDCRGMSAIMALLKKGYVIENPQLLAAYNQNKTKYEKIFDKVGLQFTATGSAEFTDACWSDSIRLEKDGVPANVVVDILKEGDERGGRDSTSRPDGSFWGIESCDVEKDNDDLEEEEKEDENNIPDVQIPLMPSLICFDLKRQKRMKIYVDQLIEYVYQTDLANKLILPDDVRKLVDLLVSRKSGFKDIIGNKGYGAILLLAGASGTGKTLSAEVYSEAMQRPLYSVQCSQLGLSPQDLEKELLQVFARAVRWNAILLLDEADVYISQRGSDLVQNAIVGVFLRVLEYYSGVMFLTTNRGDLVDDAIASRCLARIEYTIPSPEAQTKIWRVLSDGAGIVLSDEEIGRIVKALPKLSGRDIKNLLKLGSMVSNAHDKPITLETIQFVSWFKPTASSVE